MDWKNRYTAYFNLCREASYNDDLFAKFKRHIDCTDMLEHVSYDLGLEYLKEINKHYPYLLKNIKDFVTNDSIGDPYLHSYEELDMKISPSNLRYIKVLGDLVNLAGCLNGLDIVEIGGGYGGQCKIIHDFAKPKSYTIIDHPDVLKLTDKYLSQFSIKRTNSTTFDLLISNYAFTEVDRHYQDTYAEKIIKYSKKGYMTCNWFGIRPDKGMTKDEILGLQPQGHFIPEVPLTGTNNCIYIWE